VRQLVNKYNFDNPESVLILIRFFYIFLQIFTLIFKIFVILNGEEQRTRKAPFNQTKIWGLFSEKNITTIVSFPLILIYACMFRIETTYAITCQFLRPNIIFKALCNKISPLTSS